MMDVSKKEGSKMNESLKQIHDDPIERGANDLLIGDAKPTSLAKKIAEYAHRNQQRENGEPYICHPLRVLDLYRNFVGLSYQGTLSMPYDLLHQKGIPLEGVEAVCLLHDVVEDTALSIDDIRALYADNGMADYFDRYIHDPLSLITHDDKAVPYPEYIQICMKHPSSAIVKMMDLIDNLKVIDLETFDEWCLNRAKDYLGYLYTINHEYHFIETVQKYKKEFYGKE